MGRGKNNTKTKEFYIFHDIHFMTFDSHLHTLQSSHTAKVKQSLLRTAHFPCDSSNEVRLMHTKVKYEGVDSSLYTLHNT